MSLKCTSCQNPIPKGGAIYGTIQRPICERCAKPPAGTAIHETTPITDNADDATPLKERELRG
jgi:hypothetical protein